MKKMICICLLLVVTLGAYLFVRNNHHVVMDVRYVLDTEIADDNFFFVRAGSLYQYNDESGVKIISKEGIRNITSTDDYLLYSNETAICRMNLDTEEITPIYISENEENQIEGVYCTDKISVFRLDFSNHYITEISLDGTVISEEIINEEEYKERKNINEICDELGDMAALVSPKGPNYYSAIDEQGELLNYNTDKKYDDISVIGLIGNVYILSLYDSEKPEEIKLGVSDREGNVTVIDGYYIGYYMGRIFVSDSKSFIFKGKSGDDKEYKIYAYIPETGEVRKLSDEGLNGYSRVKIDIESGTFYIWDTKGREDIKRYRVNYDENGYPVSLEYDKVIFESDIK